MSILNLKLGEYVVKFIYKIKLWKDICRKNNVAIYHETRRKMG